MTGSNYYAEPGPDNAASFGKGQNEKLGTKVAMRVEVICAYCGRSIEVKGES